tara:strand:+ start:607 stop:792 length:186 start_codon:yes stop_codon:yes gene_type:complete
MGTVIPRWFSASRNNISICALALRNSAAAKRSIAAWTAGSKRRAKAFFRDISRQYPVATSV